MHKGGERASERAVYGEVQLLSSLKEILFHPSPALQSSPSGPSATGGPRMMRPAVPRASTKPVIFLFYLHQQSRPLGTQEDPTPHSGNNQ